MRDPIGRVEWAVHGGGETGQVQSEGSIEKQGGITREPIWT